MRKVVLISCVKRKQTSGAPARDLYTSPYFRKARAYAENKGDAWFILSAKYGLVAPDEMIAPYDETLSKKPSHERLDWAEQTYSRLSKFLQPGDEVIFVAGVAYRGKLAPMIEAGGWRIRVPFAGMPIGRQMRALGEAIASH